MSAQLDANSLPSPVDFPDADVLIFDGHCRFCRGQVERIRRFDGRNRVAYLSLHDPLVAERYPDLSHDELMRQMYLVDQQGRRHGGAAALRYLSRRLPRLWWLAPVLHIPFSLPLWSWIYGQIAKRRYRLSGTECDNGACQIHLKRR